MGEEIDKVVENIIESWNAAVTESLMKMAPAMARIQLLSPLLQQLMPMDDSDEKSVAIKGP